MAKAKKATSKKSTAKKAAVKKAAPRKAAVKKAAVTGRSAAVTPGHRVVVFLQENKTTDFYFPTLAGWGAAVANHGDLLSAPPNFDQPHDRNAWVHYAMGDYPALDVQIDNDR